MIDFRGKNYTRGLKNNNPTNLEKSVTGWQGKVPHNMNTDKRFEQFISVEYGLRAGMKNVITWVNRGYNTIAKLINKWAPASENNTNGYIKSVSKAMGISSDTPLQLSEQELIRLIKAIVKVEIGNDYNHIPDSSYKEAYKMIGAYELKKK